MIVGNVIDHILFKKTAGLFESGRLKMQSAGNSDAESLIYKSSVETFQVDLHTFCISTLLITTASSGDG